MKHSPGSTASHPLVRRGRRLLIPITILLLVGLACAVPDLGQLNRGEANATLTPFQIQPTATAGMQSAGGEQSNAQAVQPTAAPNYPPALVEVDPLPGSEIGTGSKPIFYFNQPMQRASVEAAFQSQPENAGHFEWLNDTTVRYVPGGVGFAQTGASLTIGTGAKASNGLSMTQVVQVHYQATGALKLAERLPKPDTADVNPASAVVVTFNRPVVALGADPQSLSPGFTLNPAANGRGEWLNTSTYIFYPQPALMGGARYSVRLNSSLTSLEGSPLDSDTSLEWSFTTSVPALLSVKPATEQPVPLDTTFTLVFNQPMDVASVEGDFSLLGPDGPVAGKFLWNDTATEMTFKPDILLQRGAGYTLALFGTARSLGGAAIGRDFAASLSTVPTFAVTQTRPSAGETLQATQGYGSLTLNFSSPVAVGQDFNQLITLNPPVVGQAVYRDTTGYELFISGYFQPSTSYTLSVSPAISDRWGARLDEPFSFTFSSQPAQPALVIPMLQTGARVIFVPQNETGLPARTTNISRMSLSRGRLSVAEFIKAEQDWNGLQDWEPKVDSAWPFILYPTPNVSEATSIPLTQNGGGLEAGLYFLNINTLPAVEGVTKTAPVLLVSSPIQIVLKVSAHQAFAWAVHVPENTPANNVTVSFYDNNAAALGSCATDGQGTCQAELPVRSDPYPVVYAGIGQPGDRDFSMAASDWYNGVAAWDFGVTYQNKGSQPEVYLYTDRPIYRPGQAVNFRAIVRGQDNGRYTPAPFNQVTVEIVSPYDPVTGQSQVLSSIRLPLDPFGAAAGVYTLPDDARPGSYTLRIQEVQFKEINFEVAEYRKPEIDLQVKFPQADILAGVDLHAQISAHYFFGAPAGNLTAHWSLFRTRQYPEIPGGFISGRLDTSWLMPWMPSSDSNVYVMDGQVQIGTDGTASITVPGQDLHDRLDTAARDMQQLDLEVTVEDEGGLPVSARGSMRIHPSSYYIGVRPEQWSGQVAQEIYYTIRTVDWQNNPAADKPLTARFLKVKWVQQQTADPLAPPDYKMETTEVGSTDFRTSQQGEARLAFTPAEPGTFMLEVVGTGASAETVEEQPLTQALTWVGGPGATEWPNLPNQHILLRSDGGTSGNPYQPGQTAHVFIPNPFEGGALGLVTVERGKVMRSFVVQIQGASYDLQLPLSNEDAPNIYVTVTLLGRTNNRPDFRVGNLELAVDPSAQVLQVEVQTSPAQPQPGEEVTVNIRVKDADGKPVEGEFSLALVDKAVLALADPNSKPIVEAFYGPQPLGVLSSYSLAEYSGRLLYSPLGRGGGAGEAPAVQAVRTNFADTAYWNGTVQTDVTGTAQIILTLPDNLTTWQANVRGLSSDARVGQATMDLTASKPLLVRPVAPRFAVPGDHLALAALVHNNTQGALQASVRMEAAGFTLDDLNQAVQRVDLQPGERRQVSWWGVVQDVAALDLTFSAEADQPGGAPLGDATHPELNPLPILPYAAPQTYGTSGILAEASDHVELVSLPRSFTPTGGELSVELTPSLSATILDGLKTLDAYPHDFTEPILSRLIPNLATYQALKDLQLEDDALRSSLQSAATSSVERLVRLQNENGGWGWAAGYRSDVYISSYALLGLSRAAQVGIFVDPQVLQKGRDYLSATLTPLEKLQPWQVDQLAFQYYVLQQAGQTDINLPQLYEVRGLLSPWGKAFLAVAMKNQSPGDQRVLELTSELQTSAKRSTTGANWQDDNPAWHSWSTPNFTTAVVVYAIAQIDPKSQVMGDATRYLLLQRNPSGGWSSSYETAWVLMALDEVMRATGDVKANYSFSARLNGSPLLEGQVQLSALPASPVTASVPLANLRANTPNPLVIQRGAGDGRLYYRAYLEVGRPAQDAPAIQRGLSISREYYRSVLDCRKEGDCQPVDTVDLSDPQPLQVRLTLTVPEDSYFVVVEDMIPAGTEVLNPRLKTSQQNIVPADGQPPSSESPQTSQPQYDLSNPFDQGWGWWLFTDPQVYDDHIRWVVDFLPAGTYELTYRLTPFLPGEFRVLPAHAWEYYFPEVEGASKGEVLTIK
jgi:alpha-2-macroglobulin